MIIIVTGTPGTGKTALAKSLALTLDYIYISDKDLIENYDLVEEHDDERDSDIIDEEKFAESLKRECKKQNCVVDSHLSHFIDPADIDLCIVTQCELETLKKRLELRDYTEEKIRENLDCEIFETIKFEAIEMGHHVLELSTEHQMEENIAIIQQKLSEIQ